MTPQNERLITLYARYSALHRDTAMLLDGIESACKATPLPGPSVDATFVLKKLSALADAMRKDANRALEIAMRVGCLHAAQSADNRVQGELSQGYGDAAQEYILPDREKNPEEYRKLMGALGLESVAENPLVKPSWSAVGELVSQRAREGLGLTPGMEAAKLVPKFRLNVRPRAGVDIDALANQRTKAGPDGAGSPYGADDIPF